MSVHCGCAHSAQARVSPHHGVVHHVDNPLLMKRTLVDVPASLSKIDKPYNMDACYPHIRLQAMRRLLHERRQRRCARRGVAWGSPPRACAPRASAAQRRMRHRRALTRLPRHAWPPPCLRPLIPASRGCVLSNQPSGLAFHSRTAAASPHVPSLPASCGCGMSNFTLDLVIHSRTAAPHPQYQPLATWRVMTFAGDGMQLQFPMPLCRRLSDKILPCARGAGWCACNQEPHRGSRGKHAGGWAERARRAVHARDGLQCGSRAPHGRGMLFRERRGPERVTALRCKAYLQE